MQNNKFITTTAHPSDHDPKNKQPSALIQQPTIARSLTNEQIARRRHSKVAKTTRIPTVNSNGASRSKPNKMLSDITGVILNNLKSTDTDPYNSNPKKTDVVSKDTFSLKPVNFGLKVVMS
jgi:hypothetical protein